MPHYYSEQQTSRFIPKKINARLMGVSFEFYTSSGVFSKKKIDKGTVLLANEMIVKKDAFVLDIGTGIGVLGITAAKLFPETTVLMTDVNKRAVKLADMNLELNLIANAEARNSNLYGNIKEKFDVILTNPPQTAGKDICFKIIEGAKEHLNKNGLLELVARHNKGGKELEKKMNAVFGNVKEIAKKGGYRIYVSKLL